MAEAALQASETQRYLIETERLAALGGLVAGVAHEINTPVGTSLTVASTLAHRCANFADQIASGEVRRSQLAEFADSCRDGADQLVANLQRAGDLIQSFKQVAVDRSHADRRTFDLKIVTEQIVASVRPGLPKPRRNSLALDVPSDITMDSYPGAYGQVLTNLIFNAVTHGFADGRRRTHPHQGATPRHGAGRDHCSRMTAAAFRRTFSATFSIRFSPPDARRAIPGSASTSSIIS